VEFGGKIPTYILSETTDCCSYELLGGLVLHSPDHMCKLKKEICMNRMNYLILLVNGTLPKVVHSGQV
jgi:hypothetical protein